MFICKITRIMVITANEAVSLRCFMIHVVSLISRTRKPGWMKLIEGAYKKMTRPDLFT